MTANSEDNVLPFYQHDLDECNTNQTSFNRVSHISHISNLAFNPLILNENNRVYHNGIYEGQDPDQYYSNAILENNESCDCFMEDQLISNFKNKTRFLYCI